MVGAPKMVLQSHTLTQIHWSLFYGLLRVATLGSVRSCVSQFYWFVTLPNHRRKEKSVKNKRKEKVHEIMEATAPKSPTLHSHTIHIYFSYIHTHIHMYVHCGTLTMRSGANAVPKRNKKIKTSNVKRAHNIRLFSPPPPLWPFSHVYRYTTSFCFRFVSIIIVIFARNFFIDCIFALDCYWLIGK